jgi:hypothetical protein
MNANLPPSFNGFNAGQSYAVPFQGQTLQNRILGVLSESLLSGGNEPLSDSKAGLATRFIGSHYNALTNNDAYGQFATAYHMANDSHTIGQNSADLPQALKTLARAMDGNIEGKTQPTGDTVVTMLAYLDHQDGTSLFNAAADSDPNAYGAEDLLRLDGNIQSAALQNVEQAYQQLEAGDATAWNTLLADAQAFHTMFMEEAR